MIQFIRLTRPLNLLIIVVSMYGLGWYFDEIRNESTQNGVTSFTFFLLVISTTMIAAAGNIINDYFDVRADRINKPEKLIIGKYVKRRVAIVTHWTINFIAFSIAIYLTWKLDTFWYLFIHLLSINLLWYYSSFLKRKFLIGNILVAGLTALVPLLVGLYFFHNQSLQFAQEAAIFPFKNVSVDSFVVYLSIGLAGFAFLLNLAREIVKDIEDVKGDKLLNAKTIPIKLGGLKTKWIIAIILLASLFGIGFVCIIFPFTDTTASITFILAAIFVVIALILLFISNEKGKFRRVNTCIKIAMIAGTLSPIFWKLLLIYGK